MRDSKFKGYSQKIESNNVTYSVLPELIGDKLRITINGSENGKNVEYKGDYDLDELTMQSPHYQSLNDIKKIADDLQKRLTNKQCKLNNGINSVELIVNIAKNDYISILVEKTKEDQNIKKYEEQLKKNEMTIKSLTQENQKLRERISKLEEENKTISSRFNEVERNLNEKDRLINQLRDELKKIQNSYQLNINESQKIEVTIKAKENEIAALKKEIKFLEATIAGLKLELTKYKSQDEEYITIINTLKKQVSHLESELSVKEKQVVQYEKTIANLQEILKILEDKNKELSKQSIKIKTSTNFTEVNSSRTEKYNRYSDKQQ